MLLSWPLQSIGQEFKSGLNLGASFTQIDGDKMSGYNKLGPHLGIFVERVMGPKLGMRLEFLFNVRGAKNYVNPENIANPFKSAQYYIEVPLLLQYQVQSHLNVETGVSFSALAYAYNRDNSGRYSTTDKFKRSDWLMHLGLQYSLKERSKVYARYSYSILSFDPLVQGRLFTAPKIRPGLYHNIVSVGIRRYFR
ncbi:MAG: PorT family protein [Bacteroidota bacterium]|nr:PorT family protein [Bacteroidota bacterium]MDX5430047.1 PorT family protein [Bacteroidota bacterium]MDX5468817.1 PorT family protein [Bacteroidota bacterium]